MDYAKTWRPIQSPLPFRGTSGKLSADAEQARGSILETGTNLGTLTFAGSEILFGYGMLSAFVKGRGHT